MNMKKLLTTTFITVFFIIGSAFCAFASENDSSEQAQQTEEAANDQDQQETDRWKRGTSNRHGCCFLSLQIPHFHNKSGDRLYSVVKERPAMVRLVAPPVTALSIAFGSAFVHDVNLPSSYSWWQAGCSECAQTLPGWVPWKS